MTHRQSIPIAHVLRRSLSVAGLATALALSAVADASAQGPADNGKLMARGKEIAAGRCGRCHSIDGTSDSPQRDVIPFRDFPARYPIAMLMEVQSTGIISGHDEMPMTALGREDVDAMLAFIDSFAPSGGPRYLKKSTR